MWKQIKRGEERNVQHDKLSVRAEVERGEENKST